MLGYFLSRKRDLEDPEHNTREQKRGTDTYYLTAGLVNAQWK